MTQTARFLHITDTHLKLGGSEFTVDDRKRDLKLEEQTCEKALNGGLERLAEKLGQSGERLDAVIFSGDALSGGKTGGDKLLLELLLKHLGNHGIDTGNIVSVPGNHDVPLGAEPGSDARYTEFLKTWRAEGCITPWLGLPGNSTFRQARKTAAGHTNAGLRGCELSARIDARSDAAAARGPSVRSVPARSRARCRPPMHTRFR
ncbi:metallophosphoesterase [Paraburkholderia dipogonis]|uniref:metallophosphoesterase n=1 Tax=Paraburkholderia dipogonis TaxID=1211383 RepID=UPI0038B8E185